MIDLKIQEKLLENNTICLFGEIDQEKSSQIVKQLLSLHLKFKKECDLSPTVILLINSPGGVVTGGMAIYDALLALNCKIVTVCLGQASSMAATLLSGGTKGFRYVLPNSEVMIHQPLGGMSGQVSDMEIHCKHTLNIKHRLNEILAKNTNQTISKIQFDTERDYFLTSSEAVEYGIVDKIISDFQEVYNELSIK